MSYPNIYAEKYRMDFLTPDGTACRVRFFFKGAATGLIAYLDPGPRPFVVSEFNSGGELNKFTRGTMATIQIVNTNAIQMDDFIAGEDETIVVQLDYNGSIYWKGFLQQDDFEEPWSDRAHYINLRATDGLGQPGGDPLVFPASGQVTMLDLLGSVLWDLPITQTGVFFLNRFYIANLFYEGMLDRADGDNTPLDQATVDVRTFEGGDSKQTVLKKTLEAWGMTVYQRHGTWWFVRMEETINGQTLKPIRIGPLTRANLAEADYVALVGNGQPIKVLAPEMLRSIRRPYQRTKIKFFYRYPKEIFCNQSFNAGDVIIPTLVRFEIDCWTLHKYPFNAPVAPTENFYRLEILDIDGAVTETYAVIEQNSGTSGHWMESQSIELNKDDVVDFSINFRFTGAGTGTGPSTFTIAIIKFEIAGGGAKYTLDDDGTWNLTPDNYLTGTETLAMSWSSSESNNTWKQYALRTKGVPGQGRMFITLHNTSGAFNWDAEFKDLQIEIREKSKIPGVIGDFDRYTLPEIWNQDYEEETFMDDSDNRQHKGTLFFGDVMTGDRWYRIDYPAERLTFKRQKAIGHMLMNRRKRMRLEVTMLGLTWQPATGSPIPIGLLNRIVFVDDAPTKQFMIANLKEIDFAAGKWQATLLETWDSAIDSTDASLYPPHDFANIYEKDV